MVTTSGSAEDAFEGRIPGIGTTRRTPTWPSALLCSRTRTSGRHADERRVDERATG